MKDVLPWERAMRLSTGRGMEVIVLAKWKEKLRQFMIGRYGVDDFSKFLLAAALVLIALSIFIPNIVFSFLILLLLIYCYYRMFSKNISARYKENQKYQMTLTHIKQLRTHHFYRCPGCRQKIRVPRSGGKRVEITCPKCKTKFIKKI